MKYLRKLIDLLCKERGYIKDIFIIIVITRLIFLEDNTLVLLAEIVGGLVMIFSSSARYQIED